MLKIIILAAAIFSYAPAFAATGTENASANDGAPVEKAADNAGKDGKETQAPSKDAKKSEAGTTADKTTPEEYSCKYFTVTLPQDWKAIVPPQEQQGNVNAIFAKNTGKPVVSMVIGPNLGADAKTIAEMFSEQFKAKKPPVEKNGQYSFSFSQNDVATRAFITVAGDEFMVMTIAGNLKEGQNFVKKNINTPEEYAKLLLQ